MAITSFATATYVECGRGTGSEEGDRRQNCAVGATHYVVVEGVVVCRACQTAEEKATLLCECSSPGCTAKREHARVRYLIGDTSYMVEENWSARDENHDVIARGSKQELLDRFPRAPIWYPFQPGYPGTERP